MPSASPVDNEIQHLSTGLIVHQSAISDTVCAGQPSAAASVLPVEVECPESFDRQLQLGISSSVAQRNGVRRVEVAVGESVAHAGDLVPRNRVLIGEELTRKGFDGFADFDEPHSHSIEDQAVGESAARQVFRIASIAAVMSSSRCSS
jgi:hypothetical protein